jgi:acyl-coenzyme A synthetase/AMP-(fatty) acid ligase
MNLTEPILRHARMQPDAIALIDGTRPITYRQLADLVTRTAGHLYALGLGAGDAVGLCLLDDWQHVVAFLAVARIGALAVQIDWRSRREERARIADAFDLKLALILPGEEIGTGHPSIPLDVEWHKAVAAAEPVTAWRTEWSTPLAALASSGTTGVPKFTIATHLQSYLHCAAYLEIVPSTRRQRFLLTLPLYFSAGRVSCLAHLLRGDTVVLGPALFTSAEFAKLVFRHHVTVGFIVPALVRQLVPMSDAGKPLFPEIDVLTSVGAPLFAEEKSEALRKLTPRFHEMYGAAAIGPISALRPEDIAERPTSVGRPFSFIDVEVVDDNDEPVGVETVGRLRCRGPGLTSPIPEASGSRDDLHHGWHYPGELATLDPLGYIHIQGRASEVIFRGGTKIFPAEIEAVLLGHEGIVEVAAVARATPDNEQELIAYVVARGAISEVELMGYCRTRLPAYKVPREIYMIKEMPRNPAGKVDKRVLLRTHPRSICN